MGKRTIAANMCMMKGNPPPCVVTSKRATSTHTKALFSHTRGRMPSLSLAFFAGFVPKGITIAQPTATRELW